MNSLSQIQKQFLTELYHNKSDRKFFAQIKEAKIAKSELVKIYQNNLFGALHNALKLTFIQCFQALGEEDFRNICFEYIALFPSKSGNLDDYGDKFAQFLESKNLPFFSDLAKMEWLKQKAYLAKNSPKLDLLKLQKTSEENLVNLVFKLNSSCFLLESRFDLSKKSHKNPKKKTQKEPQKEPQKNSSKTRYFYCIHRTDFQIQTLAINQMEFQALSAIKNSQSFEEIFKITQNQLQNFLQKFIANQVISKFKISKKINKS